MKSYKTNMKQSIEELEHTLGKWYQKIKKNTKWKIVSDQWASSLDHVFKNLLVYHCMQTPSETNRMEGKKPSFE